MVQKNAKNARFEICGQSTKKSTKNENFWRKPFTKLKKSYFQVVLAVVVLAEICILRNLVLEPKKNFVNDKNETKAFKSVFGDHASSINISSTKSMTGHLLGAAAGIELIACAKAIQEGVIPPTINQFTPDPECDLNYTPNEAVKRDVGYAMSTSFGFGGHNAVLIIKHPDR